MAGLITVNQDPTYGGVEDYDSFPFYSSVRMAKVQISKIAYKIAILRQLYQPQKYFAHIDNTGHILTWLVISLVEGEERN